MDRNVEYKQVYLIRLYGYDDVNTSINSQYELFSLSIPSIIVPNGCSNYVVANTQIVILNNNSSGFSATVDYTHSPSQPGDNQTNVTSGAITSITVSNGCSLVSAPSIFIFSGVVGFNSILVVVDIVMVHIFLIATGGGGSGFNRYIYDYCWCFNINCCKYC